jgi:hypothetical protein
MKDPRLIRKLARENEVREVLINQIFDPSVTTEQLCANMAEARRRARAEELREAVAESVHRELLKMMIGEA